MGIFPILRGKSNTERQFQMRSAVTQSISGYVGAGPGDVEPLSLKAKRAVEAAQVVLHDRLISEEILELSEKSDRFVQSRLTKHDANRATPVTLVENSSRRDQRVLEATLDQLPTDSAAAEMNGPAQTLFGLTPRQAAAALNEPNKELA